MSWGLGQSSTALASWQLIYLVIGSITVFFASVAFFMLPSIPLAFKLFTHEEKVVSVWREADNQTGIKHNKTLSYQIKEAFTRVLCVAMQQLSIGIINSAITNFMSALFRGFWDSSIHTVLWQLPNRASQLVATVAAGFFASRFRNTTVLTSVMIHIPFLAGILGVALIPLQDKNRLALTACCWLLDTVGGISFSQAQRAGHHCG